MSRSARRHVWTLMLLTGGAWGGEGLSLPNSEPLWPRWQARVELSAPYSVGSLTSVPGVSTRRMALLGDFYPDLPWLAPSKSWQGGVRASGGLLIGQPGQVGASVWPYFGVGYTGLSRRSGWGFAADLGLVVQNPREATLSGGTVGGPQSLDDAIREIRLSPFLQLGVRYSF